MALDPMIEEWMESRRRKDRERLEELEEKAAEAWVNSLSAEQREVFMELQKVSALYRLRWKRLDARTSKEGRGFT
jgi:hypothetical protein